MPSLYLLYVFVSSAFFSLYSFMKPKVHKVQSVCRSLWLYLWADASLNVHSCQPFYKYKRA